MHRRTRFGYCSDKERMLFTDLEVCEKLSIGRSTLWKMARTGKFPKPICVSPKIRRWHRKDVDQWLETAEEVRNADR